MALIVFIAFFHVETRLTLVMVDFCDFCCLCHNRAASLPPPCLNKLDSQRLCTSICASAMRKADKYDTRSFLVAVLL